MADGPPSRRPAIEPRPSTPAAAFGELRARRTHRPDPRRRARAVARFTSGTRRPRKLRSPAHWYSWGSRRTRRPSSHLRSTHTRRPGSCTRPGRSRCRRSRAACSSTYFPPGHCRPSGHGRCRHSGWTSRRANRRRRSCRSRTRRRHPTDTQRGRPRSVCCRPPRASRRNSRPWKPRRSPRCIRDLGRLSRCRSNPTHRRQALPGTRWRRTPSTWTTSPQSRTRRSCRPSPCHSSRCWSHRNRGQSTPLS